MENLIKINNIAVGWMEGHFHGEDVQTSECHEKSFAAMKEICELSKYPNPDDPNDGWTPCEVELPKKPGYYFVTVAAKISGIDKELILVDKRKFTEKRKWCITQKTNRRVIAWKSAAPWSGEKGATDGN